MGTGEQGKISFGRVWLLPFLVLLGAALTVFVFTFLLDAGASTDPDHVLGLVLRPNPESALATLSNAGEIVAAVLAIAITVVAIVVELAANRYTHRITELFIGEPINFFVTGFFVMTALQSLWVTIVFDYDPVAGTGFVPHVGIAVAMVMLAICLLLLLPYFGFVFAFLNPIHIVGRIRTHTLEVVAKSRGMAWRQREAVRGIEQLADVGLNAMEHKDKGVSMASVDALAGMVQDYHGIRKRLPKEWFVVEGWLAANSDFVSMAPEVLRDVSERKIWFEMKVLRQFQTIYNEALNRMRDVNYVIAISTRRMAEKALEEGDEQVFDLCLKFFNTYLRSTINGRDIRTAYNVLNQYRLLAEAALTHGREERAVEIARYFKYYGLTGYGSNLGFVLETVAYDLCSLCVKAFDEKNGALDSLLRIFLEVDQGGDENDSQEMALRGVRKAQVKLATHFLIAGDLDRARRIHQDMESEQPERLGSIRDELLMVRTSEFWEISDRGANFDYLTPAEKEKMLQFF
ncbi:MAG: DUF2254 domain-containing protein, partial [Myxococcales bacterium]|nr:DUF2254 domain-containing protein [Myxococcales bacterium]